MTFPRFFDCRMKRRYSWSESFNVKRKQWQQIYRYIHKVQNLIVVQQCSIHGSRAKYILWRKKQINYKFTTSICLKRLHFWVKAFTPRCSNSIDSLSDSRGIVAVHFFLISSIRHRKTHFMRLAYTFVIVYTLNRRAGWCVGKKIRILNIKPWE